MLVPRKTLFVDVSEIVVMGGQSGIQRVVRRIVQQANAECPLGYRLEPVVSAAGRLWPLNDKGHHALRTGEVSSAPGRYDMRPEAPERRFPVDAAKALVKLVPALYDRLRDRAMEQDAHALAAPKPIRFGADDVYVLLDSFWVKSSAPSTAVRLRRRGHKVVAVIYDVLMISHPEYVPSAMVGQFRDALHKMIDGGVAFISISRSAANAAVQAIPSLKRSGVGHFYLGNDMLDLSPMADVRWPSGLWTGEAVFMTVGTFETRKNHAVLLAAFEQLWRDGHDVKLLMIGQRANGVDDLLMRLADHPELGRRLFVFHDADDAMVVNAYRRATALIFPSLIEGFGLPLVEGLGLGLPVIASDIDVFREIGSGVCRFFDHRSPEALVEAVHEVVADLANWRTRAAKFRWPSWKEATLQFVSAVSAATQSHHGHRDIGHSDLSNEPVS